MNKCRIFFFIVVFFIFVSQPCLGQRFPALHYTVEDGLPSNTVYASFCDMDGFLWVATDKGVARFNGMKFEVFTTFNGLPDNEIFSINQDYEKRIWFGSYSGEPCFYENGEFHTAVNTPFLRLPFHASFIENIFIEQDSSVTIKYYDKIHFLNIKHNALKCYNLSNVHVDDNSMAYYLRKVSETSYYIRREHASFIMDTAYHITGLQYHQNGFVGLMTGIVRPAGRYRMYKDTLIKVPDMATAHRDQLSRPAKERRNYFQEGDDVFIIKSDGIFTRDSTCLLRKEKISGICYNYLGNYVVTTLNDGVYIVSKDLTAQHYSDVYQGEVRYAVSTPSGVYMAASNKNLYRYQDGKFTLVFNYATLGLRSLQGDIAGNAAFLLHNKSYYYFYVNEAVYIPDVTASVLVKKYYTSPQFDNFSKAYMADSNVYLRRPDAVYRVRTNMDFLTQKKLVEVRPPNLKERIIGMAQDPEGSIWFSTVLGMYKIAGNKPVLQTAFKQVSLKSFGFFGKYLVGYTAANKLFIYSHLESDLMVDSITNENCIWDKIYALDSTHIILSTNLHYRLLTLMPSSPLTKSSLIVVENSFLPLYAESLVSDSRFCYFFKKGSVVKLPVTSIISEGTPPRIFFKHFRTGNSMRQVDSMVTLSYRQAKDVSIAFLALAPANTKVFYAYSISKGEDNWLTTTDDEINFLNPTYGTYIVKLKARTAASKYCEPVNFILVIERPCWATWWFITLVAATAAGAVALLVRYNLKQAFEKKEKAHLVEVRYLKSEYKALNALMNPHFIFNTLNNVQGLINKDEKRPAMEYLRIFANLIRQNMHNISLEMITLQSEMELIHNYLKLEKLRFKDLLNFNINVAADVDLSEVMIPPLLIQPLVENAIKHGLFPKKSTGNFLGIEIFERSDFLVVAIKDNGIGFDAANRKSKLQHESFGLLNIKKRIEHISAIHNKEIFLVFDEQRDTDGVLLWTVVSVSISLLDVGRTIR
ncbi:MAG: histidine kinase [Taibaiella sp.]|nr:histidine kinase [Taibaiella sp.]